MCCLLAAMGLNAQNQFVVSPVELDGASLSLYGETLSENLTYVAGQEQNSQCPFIWNTVTGQVVILQDSELLVDEFSGEPYQEDWTGCFHSVTENGLAVGEFGAPSAGSHAIVCDINNPNDYIVLYEEDGDAGNVAYGISADGNTVVGFHFDAAWVTHGCVWTDGGATRTDLPWPTVEECGFDVDYASARGMSADGSVITGYAQEANYGSWVFVCWERQADGSYAVNASAANKYFEYDYDLGKPYMTFEPHAVSKNGEWVTLTVEAEFDPWDWSHEPAQRSARLNIKTNELQVLDVADCQVFGIANNGTAVGRAVDQMWNELGVVWYAGEEDAQSIVELCPEASELADAMSTSVSSITGDASVVVGVCLAEVVDEGQEWPTYVQATYVAEIPVPEIEEPVSIKGVHAPVMDGVVYDLMGRRVLNTKGHITIVNGKKTL